MRNENSFDFGPSLQQSRIRLLEPFLEEIGLVEEKDGRQVGEELICRLAEKLTIGWVA